MWKKLSDFFDGHLQIQAQTSGADRQHTLQLATAALLIEMTRADFEIKAIELEKIMSVMKGHFSLSDDETAELIELAETEADNAVTLHEFTSLLNDSYSYEEKIEVIRLLWEIAYADGEIEKYEDYLVRKVAELLYVKHRDFIGAKLQVSDAINTH